MYNISTAIAIICKSHVLCTSDFFSLSNYTSGLVKLFDALSQLLKWLDHLVLHCTDEAKLDQKSSCSLHFRHHTVFLSGKSLRTIEWHSTALKKFQMFSKP